MAKWTQQTAKNQLRKDQEIAKLGQVGKKVKGTSGRCTLAVDQETYIKTIERNGGVQEGGKTIFDNPEFVQDMKRNHEHLREPGESRLPKKWGRVKERIRFLTGGIKETFDCNTGQVTHTHPDGREEVFYA